jgi:beta-lactamase class A
MSVPGEPLCGRRSSRGDWGTRNDVAVAWPPHGAPVVIAILSNRDSINATSDDALIADATRIALADLS